MAGLDRDLAAFCRSAFGGSIFDVNALASIVVGYDSIAADVGSYNQGSLFRAMVQRAPFPPQSDGSPAIVSLAGTAQPSIASTSRVFHAKTTTNGWGGIAAMSPGSVNTLLNAVAPVAGDSINSNMPCIEFSWANGATLTAFELTGSNNLSTSGVVMIVMPHIDSDQLGPAGAEVAWGNPFDGRRTTGRMISMAKSNGAQQLSLRGMRQADMGSLSMASQDPAVGTFFGFQGSVTRTNWISANSPYSGAVDPINLLDVNLVVYHDVDCADTPGNPSYALCNPSATGSANVNGSGAARNHCYLGSRFFRRDASVGVGDPFLTGIHFTGFGAAAMNMGHMMTMLGVAKSGGDDAWSPDPWFSSANAGLLFQYMGGMDKTNTNFPTHFIFYDGHNLSGAESTELTAGTITLATSYRVRVINAIKAMAELAAAPVPKFLFVIAAAHRSGKTTRQTDALHRAIDAAAVATGSSVLDIFIRTNTAAYDVVGAPTATPWAAYIGFASKGASINSVAVAAVTPASATKANPCVVTVTAGHGIPAGEKVPVFFQGAGGGSQNSFLTGPSLAGAHIATYVSATTFSINLDTSGSATGAGAAGQCYIGPMSGGHIASGDATRYLHPGNYGISMIADMIYDTLQIADGKLPVTRFTGAIGYSIPGLGGVPPIRNRNNF